MHSDATGYLREWIESDKIPQWLRNLVHEILATQSSLEDENVLERLCNALLIEEGLKSAPPVAHRQEMTSGLVNHPTEEPDTETNSSFTITSISGVEGVNLLRNDQALNFSPSLTVVYGLNGSGKTGYFRVLNAISARTADNKEEDIIGNIFLEEQAGLSAQIGYKLGNDARAYHWNGEKGDSCLKDLEVFDTAFSRAHLSRKQNEFQVTPFRTGLFPMVAEGIDKVQATFDDIVKERRDEYQKIQQELLTKVSQRGAVHSFVERMDLLSEEERANTLKGLLKWTTEDVKALEDKGTEYRKVVAKASEEGKKGLQVQLSDLGKLYEALLKVLQLVQKEEMKNAKDAISKLLGAKKKMEDEAQKLEVLQTIPSGESPEWKSFLVAGETYRQTAGINPYPSSDTTCLYCGQDLEEPALKRVQAFQSWLYSKASEELSTAEEELAKAAATFGNVCTLGLSEAETERLKELLGEEVFGKAESFVAACEEHRKQVEGYLKALKWGQDIATPEDGITPVISGKKSSTAEALKNFDSLVKGAQEKERTLQKEMQELRDRQQFTLMKEQILKSMKHISWLQRAENIQFEGYRRSCSLLRTKAERDLLGTTFTTRFEVEKKKLRVRVPVEVNMHTSDAVSERRKSIGNWRGNIDAILSEGEQKAISLADFFAELSLKRSRAPIVFDDPVTSLDDVRMEQIAKRLTEEVKAGRQIIIFTHSRAFYFALMSALRWHEDETCYKNPYANGCALCWDTENGPKCTKKKRCHNSYQIMESGESVGIVMPEAYGDNVPILIAKTVEAADRGEISPACHHLREAIEHFLDEVVLAKLRSKYWPERHEIDWKATAKVRPLSDEERALITEAWGVASGNTHLSERRGSVSSTDIKEHASNLKELYDQCVTSPEIKSVTATKVQDVKDVMVNCSLEQ